MNLIRRGEYHAFAGGDARFLYLVPSAAVVRIDDVSQAVLDCARDRRPVAGRSHRLARRPLDVRRRQSRRSTSCSDFARVFPVVGAAAQADRREAEAPDSAQTLVLNVTSKCNLSCGYCYEYGEDRSSRRRQAAVHERGDRPAERRLHVRRGRRFADGESDVLRRRDADELQGSQISARVRARTRRRARQGCQLEPHDERDAAARRGHRLDRRERRRRHGVDRRRARAAGQVSHRSRTAWAATTSSFRTSSNCSRGIGAGRLARASRSPDRISTSSRSTSICSRRSASGKSASRRSRRRGSASTRFRTTASRRCSSGFQTLAADFLAVRARRTAPRILERARHARGDSQRHEQGLSVRRGTWPHGRGDRRRRRALPPLRGLEHAQARHRVRRRRSRAAGRFSHEAPHREQDRLLDVLGPAAVRGRCYHEAHTRYGSTVEPNLHYCDWIRSWTNTCLEVYGTLAERAPEFLTQFDR